MAGHCCGLPQHNGEVDGRGSPRKRNLLGTHHVGRRTITTPTNRTAVTVDNRGVSPVTLFGTDTYKTRFLDVARRSSPKLNFWAGKVWQGESHNGTHTTAKGTAAAYLKMQATRGLILSFTVTADRHWPLMQRVTICFTKPS